MSTTEAVALPADVDAIDQTKFRSIVGRFASGVTVITNETDGVRVGSTASAFCSLSAEPPMVLVCLNRSSRTCRQIEEAGTLVVNILGHHQLSLAKTFASTNPDKFEGIDVHAGEKFGDPVLDQALAYLECRVVETSTGGTHTVFMAQVLHGDLTDGEPLAYFRGKFGKFVGAL